MKTKSYLFLVCIVLSFQLQAQYTLDTTFTSSATTVFTTDFFRTIAVSTTGEVWAGSNGQGLYKYDGEEWTKAYSFTTHSFRQIIPGEGGNVWIAQSGYNGIQTINGGIDEVSSDFTRTHYGGLEGLASRYCYGLSILANNTVFLTSGPISTSGGGVQMIENGIVSPILGGLPSGGLASERKCAAIGSDGTTEVWVGVERACAPCQPAYIVRYTISGEWIGQINTSNSSIPFNTSPSIQTSAIHFFNNQVWVGMKDGGIFIYNRNEDTWTHIDENNSVFPIGATINPQAITSSNGRVFIGTSNGLVVFDSYYELSDEFAFSVINVGEGFSNGVNGVAVSTDGSLWCATGAGIVKLSNSDDLLTGTVKQALFSPSGAGPLTKEPLSGATVYVYENLDSEVLIFEGITDDGGGFSFDPDDYDGEMPEDNLHLKIEFENSEGEQFSYSSIIPAFGNFNPVLTSGLYKVVENSLENDTSFTVNSDYFFGLITSIQSLSGYNIASLTQVLEATKSLGHEPDQDMELEALARTRLVADALNKTGNNGLKASSEIVASCVDLCLLIVGEFNSKSDITSYFQDAEGMSLAEKKLASNFVKANVDGLNVLLKKGVKKALANVDDPILQSRFESGFNSLLDHIAIKVATGEYSIKDFGIEVVKESVKTYVISFLSEKLFTNWYIPKTQQNLQIASQAIANLSVIGEFTQAETGVMNLLDLSENYAEDHSNNAETANDVSEFAQYSESILDLAFEFSVPLVFTGVGALVVAKLKLAAQTAKAVKYAAKATAIGISAYSAYQIAEAAEYATLLSYDPTFDYDLRPAQGENQNLGIEGDCDFEDLNVQIELYNSNLSGMVDLLNSNNEDGIITAMSDYLTEDSLLSLEVSTEFSQLIQQSTFASSEIFTTAVVQEGLIGGFGDNLKHRASLKYLLAAYLISPTEIGLIDSIVVQAGNIISQNAVTMLTLNEYCGLVSTTSIPPYITEITYPQNTIYPLNTQQNLTIAFKNIGAQVATNVSAKIILNENFVAELDSVFIGDIAAGEEQQIVYILNTPDFEDVSSYEVIFYSDNAMAEGFGGAVGTIIPDVLVDCAGVENGMAILDNCGVCSGGTTGVEPNASCTDCNDPIILECPFTEASYTYDEGAVSNSIFQASCFPESEDNQLRDLWFTFNADGITQFYFGASNANVGLIVYSGTCGDLEIYDCEESQDNTSTYWEPYFTTGVVPAGQYFIQLLHVPYLDNEEADIVLNCYEIIDWDCSVTLDYVEIGTCLDDDGFVNVLLAGTTDKEHVIIDIRLDGSSFLYDGVVDENTWEAIFTIQGAVLTGIIVSAGDAETGCSIDQFELLNLPQTSCNAVEDPDLLEFSLNPVNVCNYMPALIKFYEPGTSNLLHTRNVEFNSSHKYIIFDPPFGTFDVYIKPFGILQEAFLSLEITEGINTVLMPILRQGDLNNSNAINVFDISILSAAYNSSPGLPNYNSLADFNCSGSINVFDVSKLSTNFNQQGAKPPVSQ